MPGRTISRRSNLASAWFAVGWLWVAGAGCGSDAPTAIRLSGPTMGTRWLVRVGSPLPAGVDGRALQRQIQAALDQVNQRMSTYVDDSEVCRFNRASPDDWLAVSADTTAVVGAGLDLGQRTGGALDITVGPLVDLWQFGARADGPTRLVPEPEKIERVRARVGQEHLALRVDPPALMKRRAGLEIDLSAIAKGFAVDRVSELLESQGIRHHLVEIGGELRSRGERPGGGAWRVGIERPSSEVRQLYTTIGLENAALATSGDYRNFFEQDRKRYGHVIDPRTGRPVEHMLASVSVIADSCLMADGLATALLVLGPEEGYDWAAENGIAALFITRTQDGFENRATSVWPAATR